VSIEARPAVAFVSIILAAAYLAAVSPRETATVLLVGDIMLSRNVAATMKETGDPELPFRGVGALLRSSDLNFGNLESPLAPWNDDREEQSAWDGAIGGESLIFAMPHVSVQALRGFQFRILGMANNHAMDQGEAGLMHTLTQLRTNGIQVAGAGASLEQAWRGQVLEVKGYRIGFLAASYASTNYESNEPNRYVARIEQLDRLRSSLHALKSRAAYIVVSMHAGEEYTGEPSAAQVRFAQAAIDAGANLVVGSHPHWLQPFERYKQGLIFYSLGNFIFDQNSSPATREGAAVRLVLAAGRLVEAQVIPIEIEDACCPRAARPDEIPGALRRMRLQSARIRSVP
jgi:poly-gamma-glutamate synthesis protein (capsule biosynthesis protein)